MLKASLVVRRSVVGATAGLLLFSGTGIHAYDDYPSDSRDRDYDHARGARDSAPPTQSSSGVPFGVSKSTAGAITGAILGAGTGAIIGSHRGRAGKGAAIGAGMGALGGYLTGRQLEAQDQALDQQDQMIDQQRQKIAKNRQILEELKRQNLDARETNRGVVVNLPNVLFEFNNARLTGEARDKVAHIASVLNDRATGRQVSIEGHADAVGSESYNQRLSTHRAQSVVQALSSEGVRQARLSSRGFGERYPVAPNLRKDGTDNPSGRAKNRRVEVVIEN
ncbi:MAG: OmpA family protein [Deltaproteobacteria bacterium]|nr:OmpA family protein [Deltaproteobacteria bacterium]